jgi:tetratricopeptide (TPR) repeat protein
VNLNSNNYKNTRPEFEIQESVNKKIMAVGIIGVIVILFLGGGVIYLLRERNMWFQEIAPAAEVTLNEQALQPDTALAGEFLAAGDLRQALDEIDRLLADFPDNPELLAMRERVLREQRLALAAEEAAAFDNAEAQFAARQRAEEVRLRREAEEAKRRAEREEIARASREKQQQMTAVNDLISRGKALLERGDFAGAEKAFAEALSRMPQGESRFEAQKLADMAEAWYDAYARNPDSPEGREAAAKAAAFAREAIAKDQTQASPYFTLGKIGRDQKDWDKAIEQFREASRRDTNNFFYAFELGRSCFTARRYTDARAAFENAVRINPGSDSSWYNLGGTLRALNRQDEALSAYRKAVSIKPDYALAHREIGRILFAKKDLRGATEAFENALRYNPGDLASLRELGAAQSEAGNFAAAENSFARALQAAPADAQTNYNMAVVKLGLNKNTEALSFARAAFESNRTNAVYAYTVGLACEALGDSDLAAAAYRNAASLDARYLRPRINLGSLYLARNDFDNAIFHLSEAFNIERTNFEVNNNLGAVYAKMENWRASVEHYERALAAQSNHPTVHLNLARAYTSAGDLAKAQNSYQAVLRLTPENWDAIFELGKIYVSMGMPDEAKKQLTDLLFRNSAFHAKVDAERILAGL